MSEPDGSSFPCPLESFTTLTAAILDLPPVDPSWLRMVLSAEEGDGDRLALGSLGLF